MRDCYGILNIHRDAAAGEIRAAFLAKIKRIHPDVAPGGNTSDEAKDLLFAYRQLRDPTKRADHDRHLPHYAAGRPQQLPPEPVRREAPKRRRRGGPAHTRSPAEQWRLRRLRAGMSVFIGLTAAATFSFALIFLRPATSDAPPAGQVAVAANAERTQPIRAVLDERLVDAAWTDLRELRARSGNDSVYAYLRQCLQEARRSSTASLVNYCLAFNDAVTQWERGGGPNGPVIATR